VPPAQTPGGETRRAATNAIRAVGAVGAMEALCCAFDELDVPGVACQLLCYAAWIVATVLYCRWLYRAYEDATRLRAEPLRFSAGQAVASFFLPFVGLIRPYRVLVELHRASDPRSPEGPWEKPFPARSWWALWLLAPVITGILDNVSLVRKLMALDLSDPSSLETLSLEGDGGDVALQVLAALVHLTLAALAILVVRSVAARQEACFRRVVA
jgi:Domain of unknown function (DUF4328)